ncbi:outer membrane protein assembly factor BamB family protein [Ponticaulis profundi]|uniref:PQQ-binding-like beta-propeller repeat protein n=1 Tax=Ponticaulis profundi TaxID=2665222 RepID=A0ABW1S4K1_9PROT
MNRFVSTLAVAVSAGLLVSCSGGGGSGSAPTPTPTPAPTPTPTPTPTPVSLTLTPSSGQYIAVEGTKVLDFSVTAKIEGDVDGAESLDVDFDEGMFQLPLGIQDLGAGEFKLEFKLVDGIEFKFGTQNGEMNFRVCEDSPCNEIVPNTETKFNYVIDSPFADWTSVQRNASHNAYVAATLDPSKFVQAWKRSLPDEQNFTTLASGAGRIYLTETVRQDPPFFSKQPLRIFALNTEDGATDWEIVPGPDSEGQSGAAFGGGKVLVKAGLPGRGVILFIDPETGEFDFKEASYRTEATFFYGLTAYEDDVFDLLWNLTGTVDSISISNRSLNYSRSLGNGTWTGRGQAVAATDESVFAFSASRFNQIDRLSGTIIRQIEDPLAPFRTYDFASAIMAIDDDNIISYTGTGGSFAHFSPRPTFLRPIVRVNFVSGDIEWRTQGSYLTRLAHANGVVYAAGPENDRMDAIDATTGDVIWSWPLPAQANSFNCNIMVTDNLAFLSTDEAVYAIDLATRTQVWKHDAPGCVSVASKDKLIIQEGVVPATGTQNYFRSTGVITAYSVSN